MIEELTPISMARALLERDLFYLTPALLANLFNLERRPVYRLLARMETEGLVAEVERGKFLLLGLQPERVLANPLFIAAQLVTPGYVSYWSALHYYGFTEQAPLTVFIATTRRKSPVTFGAARFRFVTLKPEKFFGYRREQVGDLPVLMADEAKSLLDSLEQPRYAGGFAEVAKALHNALGSLDVATLVEYAVRLDNQSLNVRLGWLLERWGQPATALLPAGGPIKLDPRGPRSGRYEARWKVLVNIHEAALLPPGVG